MDGPPIRAGTAWGDDQRPNLRAALMGIDAVAVALAWWPVAAYVTLSEGLLWAGETGALLVLAPGLTLAFIAATRLYRARECAIRAAESARIMRASLLGGASTAVTVELLGFPWSARHLVAGSALAVVWLIIGRTLYRGWLAKRRRRGASRWPVVIIGANEEAANLYRLAVEHPEHGFEVRGVVGSLADAQAHLPDVPWLGETGEILGALREAGAGGVLVATSGVSPAELNDLVRGLLDRGVHVRLSSGLQGIAQHRLRSTPLVHEPLFYIEQHALEPWELAVKRLLDYAVAVAALVVLAPLMVATAAAIKAAEPNAPVFFRQQRVGRDGQLFTLVKFRTMVVDAEKHLEALRAANQRMGPLFKMVDDPRVTPLGRFLRLTSLDELPQLFNVLQGRMSLVGPRPALPEEAAQFSERLRSRSQVLPGITGLWQVEARDNPSFWSYERLDVFYTENWSVGLDLGILVSTAFVVADRGVEAVRGLWPSRHRSRRAVTVLE